MIRWLILAMLAAPFALRANTTAFSSCTAGTTTASPCPSAGLTDAPYDNWEVSASAQATDTPLGSISLAAATEFDYLPCPGCPNNPALSATASASVSDLYGTNGPTRPGWIQLSVTEFGLNGIADPVTGDLFTIATLDGVYSYSGCPPGHNVPEECNGSALLPFELGTQFSIHASTPAVGSFTISAPAMAGLGNASRQDQITATFSLFESDQTTPVPLFLVPEPATFGLFVFGLLAYGVRRTRRGITRVIL